MTPAAGPDRLFDLLPLIHRMRDEEAGHPLRDLLRVVAEQVEVVEGDIARLYDNWFVETADDWVVPYLGDLVGWTPVPEAGNVLVARRDVANTVRYRRRKGTLALLDDLARDVGGWPGHAVELARLLRYCQNVDHVRLARGRSADVRDTVAMELVDTPFDSLARTVDVRRPSSRRTPGRHNLPGVALFAWRLQSYSVTRTPAAVVERVGRWAWTCNAIGFDAPLFTAPSGGPRRGPLDVPGPIARRHFEEVDDDGRRHVAAGYYGEGRSLVVWAPDWPARGEGRPVPVEQVIPADLSQWDAYRPRPGTVAVDPALGRLLFPRRNPPKRVYVSYRYGFSADMGGGEYERRPAGEAEWYRAAQDSASLRRSLQEWEDEQPERAVVELVDSDVYSVHVEVALRAGQSLVLRAADRVRAVLWLADRRSDRADSFSATLAPGATLVLDGLLVAGRAVHVEGGQAPPRPSDVVVDDVDDERDMAGGDDADAPADEVPSSECVAPARLVVRHCTFVPGWLPMGGSETEAPPTPALELVDLDGVRVEVGKSIMGSIQVVAGHHDGDPLRLHVADSILDASSPALEAIGGAGPGAAYAVVRVVRSTVFGQVHVHAMELGEDSIFEGIVKVARRGHGCVRFSSVVPGSRTPRRFRCQPDLAVEALGPPSTVDPARREEAERSVRPRFTSTRYPDPGYAQLSCTCPDEVRLGSAGRSEMGAFHDLFQLQREAALEARAEEHTPAGMDVAVVQVT